MEGMTLAAVIQERLAAVEYWFVGAGTMFEGTGGTVIAFVRPKGCAAMKSYGLLGGGLLGAVIGAVVPFVLINVVGTIRDSGPGSHDGGPGEAMFYWSLYIAPFCGVVGAVAGAWYGTRDHK